VSGRRASTGDAADVEALVADRYLDELLGTADARSRPVPEGAGAGGPGDADLDPALRDADLDPALRDADLDPALRDAARVLRHALVRLHPSFRFEEHLAARLAAVARSDPLGDAGWGRVIPFTATPPTATTPTAPELVRPDPWLDAILSGALDAGDDPPAGGDSRLAAARRPLLVGGAITSAALSLAGVAWVAWRVARPAVIAEIEGTA
jgi:hypothetical protein